MFGFSRQEKINPQYQFECDIEGYLFDRFGVSVSWSNIKLEIDRLCRQNGWPRDQVTIRHPVLEQALQAAIIYDAQSVNGIVVAI